MQLWALGVLASPVLLTTVSPSAIIAALKVKLQLNAVAGIADFGIQAGINYANHRSILENWNPVSTAFSLSIGAPTHSLCNIAGVSLINSTFSNSFNLSYDARAKGNVLSFNLTSILINTAFGTAAGMSGNQMKVDSRNLLFGEGASQVINLGGAAVDDKTKDQ